jgi:hypothetical protein
MTTPPTLAWIVKLPGLVLVTAMEHWPNALVVQVAGLNATAALAGTVLKLTTWLCSGSGLESITVAVTVWKATPSSSTAVALSIASDEVPAFGPPAWKIAVTVICGEPTATDPAVAVIEVVPAWLLVIVTEQVPPVVVHEVALKVPMTPETRLGVNTTWVPSTTGLFWASLTVATMVSVTPAAIVLVLVLLPSIFRVEFPELDEPGTKVTGIPVVGENAVPPDSAVTVYVVATLLVRLNVQVP